MYSLFNYFFQFTPYNHLVAHVEHFREEAEALVSVVGMHVLPDLHQVVVDDLELGDHRPPALIRLEVERTVTPSVPRFDKTVCKME